MCPIVRESRHDAGASRHGQQLNLDSARPSHGLWALLILQLIWLLTQES